MPKQVIKFLFSILLSTLITLLCFANLGSPIARAEEFSISCGDTNRLIDVITETNTNGEDDVITLTNCAYPLTAVYTDVSGPTGLPPITENRSLTIIGQGAIIERVGGSPAFRILHIATGARVTIKDLTIGNGLVSPTNNGGGIYNAGILSLENVTIRNSQAFQGGGLYNAGGTITLQDSNLTGHTATEGGGLYNAAGTIKLTGGMIQNSQAITGNGGGLLNIGGSVTLAGLTIDQNQAADQGGGLSSSGGSLNLENSTLSNNTASEGGGLHSNNATLTLNRNLIQANRSTLDALTRGGSGLFIENNSLVSIDRSHITDNQAKRGGGLLVNNSQLTIENSTLSGNIAGRFGGGLYNYNNSQTNLTNVTLSGNTATERGGGVFNITATLTLDSVTVAGNNAGNQGGGLRQQDSGTINLSNSLIADNTAGNAAPDCSGPVTSNGYNLILSLIGCTVITTTGDLTGVDPQLQPLADNNGTTPTHALGGSSPAIDTGACTQATDQRGSPRPDLGNTLCDIGAYEANPEVDLVISKTADPSGTLYPGDPLTYTLHITNRGSGLAWRVILTDLIPISLTNRTVTTQGLVITPQGGSAYVWQLENLAAGQGGWITITGRLADVLILNAPWLTTTAEITTASVETNLADNTATVSHKLSATCWARVGDTIYGSQDASALQAAVDGSAGGETIRLAGNCQGVANRAGSQQTVYIDKALTLAGGYDSADGLTTPLLGWRTRLDAQSLGRVVRIENAVEVTLRHLEIRNGHTTGAGDHGGGVWGPTAIVNLDQSEVISNVVSGPGSQGGGLAVNQLHLINSRLETNRATGQGGGGAIAGRLTVSGFSTLQGNQAGENGGGLYAPNGPSDLTGILSLTANQAGGQGGGAYLGGNVNLTGGEFRANQARRGGGLWLTNGQLTVTGSQLIANTATEDGGGLAIGQDGAATTADLSNLLLASNTALSGGNGLLIDSAGGLLDVTLRHSTLAAPSLTPGSGILVADARNVQLSHNIIAQQAIGVEVVAGTVTEDYSLFFGNGLDRQGGLAAGPNSFNGDPAFVDPADHNYRLAPTSWAINQGPSLGVTTDFEGDSRPQGGGADLGYDETPFVTDLAISKTVVTAYGVSGLAIPGEPITYRVVFSQAGDGGWARGVILSDILPLSLTNVVTSYGAEVMMTPTGSVDYVWQVADLAAGQGGWVTISGQVEPTISQDGPLTNTAHLSSLSQETDSTNNTATVGLLIAPPRVSLSKTVAPAQLLATPGLVTYSLVLSNGGTGSALGLRLTDSLPSEVDFVGWLELPAGAGVAADVVTWQGNLAGQTALTISFQARHIGDYGEVVSNTAWFSQTAGAANQGGTATASFTVPLVADMQISKVVTPTVAAPGERITYSLIFSNSGAGRATGIIITDRWPVSLTQLTVISHGPAISQVSGSPNLVWQVADMLSQTQGQITLTGQIDPVWYGPYWLTNSVAITMTPVDTDTSTNEAAVGLTVAAACFAQVGGGTYSSLDSGAVQQAVAAAGPGDLVKVAGVCAGVSERAGEWQTVYLDQGITLRGGYTSSDNLTVHDPVNQPTVIEAQKQGRVVRLAAAGQSVSLENLTLTNGQHAGPGGGIGGAANLSLINSRLISNQTTAGRGGGLALTGDLSLIDSLIQDNQATGDGGGLAVYGRATIGGSRFEENKSDGGLGGGLLVTGELVISSSDFLANQASKGAAIGQLTSGPTNSQLDNLLLVDNQAATEGNGLYVEDSGGSLSLTMRHTTLAWDSSSAGGLARGSGIYLSQVDTATIVNSIIASQTTGILAVGGSVTEDYSLFFGNDNDRLGDLTAGPGSFRGDPRFSDPAGGDYRLAAGSWAINAGLDVGLAVDFEGQARPFGLGYDVGYDEAPFDPQVDLAISKSVDPLGPVAPGDWLTYTIAVSHSGTGGLARSVWLTDSLPVSVTWEKLYQTSGLTVSEQGGVNYSWRLADLTAGQSGVITLRGQVGQVGPGLITNQAVISSRSVESSRLNNLAEVSVAVELIELGVGPAVASEAAGWLQFPIRLSRPSQISLTVTYSTSNGTATAGADYLAQVGQSQPITAGLTGITLSIPIVDDVWDEADETVQLTISSPNAVNLSQTVAVGTIVDDDARPGVVVSPTGGFENSGPLSFRIELTAASSFPITVSYESQAITATPGNDYQLVSGTVVFQPNELLKTVAVPLVNDEIAEVEEWFELVVVTVEGPADLSQARGRGVIRDDDRAAVILTALAGRETTEGGGRAEFRVTLGSQPTAAVEVNLSSSDLTEGTVAPARLTIQPHEWLTGAVISLTGVDDPVVDGDQSYQLRVESVTSGDPLYDGLPVTPTEVVNRDDDRRAIVIGVSSNTGENGFVAGFSVSLGSQPTAPVTVTVSSSDLSEGVIIGPTSLVFDPGTWNVAQSSQVRGVDDGEQDGHVGYLIRGVGQSADPDYNGLSGQGDLLNVDDDIPPNQPPTIEPIADQVMTEDGVITVPLRIGDDQTDPRFLTLFGLSSNQSLLPNHQLWFSGQGAARLLHLRPAANQQGSVLVEITVSDGAAASRSRFQLTVLPVNDPPQVGQQMGGQILVEDELWQLDLAAGGVFYDVEGDVLSYTAHLSGGLGLPAWLRLQPSGLLSGTPTNEAVGEYVIELQASDGLTTSPIITVSLVVSNVNEAPYLAIPLADQRAVEELPFRYQLPPGSFLDPDVGDRLSYTARLQLVGPASAGRAEAPPYVFDPASQSLSGTAGQGAVGLWWVTITATDLAGASISGQLTITVQNANDPPWVVEPPLAVSWLEDEPASLTLPRGVFSDTDPGDRLRLTARLASGQPLPDWLRFESGMAGESLADPFTATSAAVGWTDDRGPGGQLSGQPPNEAVGAWLIEVTAQDEALATARTTLSLTVVNVNDRPVAVADLGSTQAGQPVTLPVLDNDYDIDVGEVIRLTGVSQPVSGRAVISQQQVIYQPPAGLIGLAVFRYTISDQAGATATATVTVVVGPSQMGQPDEVTLAEDRVAEVAVLANDQATPGHHLRLVTVGQPQHGRSAISGSRVIYTPTANYFGADELAYVVSDGQLVDLVTVTVTVRPINDPPQANDDWVTTYEETAAVVTVLGNDWDVEGDELRISEISQPLTGTVTMFPTRLIYQPPAGFSGIEEFTYVVSDGQLTDTARVTVTVERLVAPIAIDDVVTIKQNQVVTIGVLANDRDQTGQGLSLLTTGQPTKGRAAISPPGEVGGQESEQHQQVIYTPPPDFVGLDQFDYTVSNGNLTDIGLVTVNIVTNRPPLARDDIITTTEGVSVLIAVLANDSDPDGDPLSLSQISQPVNGIATISGNQVIYQPEAGFASTDSFITIISDGQLTATSGVVITVTPDVTPPQGIELISPINEAVVTTNQPQLTWTPGHDDGVVVSYTMVISYWATSLDQLPTEVRVITTGQTTTYTPPTDWPAGVYQWTVIAHDGGGNMSPPVTPERFSIKASRPAPIYLPIVVR